MLKFQCCLTSYLKKKISRRAFKKLLIKSSMGENQFDNALAIRIPLAKPLPQNEDERWHVLKKAALKTIDRQYTPHLRRKNVPSPIFIQDIQTYKLEEVRKLFEEQHQYRWTDIHGKVNHEPEEFSFYRFCQQEGCQDFLTYNIRRAHVSERLWRAQDQLRQIRHLKGLELCPPVFARSLNGRAWAKWTYNEGAWKNSKPRRNKVNINWIENDNPNGNHHLQDFITANSKQKNYNHFPDGKNQLYWAVLKEDDPADYQQNENFPLKAQVYVGKAQDGIEKRWKQHCKAMEDARDIICSMVTYNGIALRSFQLVDLRLLLHKAMHQNGDYSGLFIMGEFDTKKEVNTAEKKHINGKIGISGLNNWKPKNMNYGMNYDNLR